MRSLMHMLFGQMIVRGKGQINIGQTGASVFDHRIRTSSTVLVTFTGAPSAVAVPQPFVVTPLNGSFSIAVPAVVALAPAPFDFVIKN